jgi:D-tyrosyl-tRNA(Tyr) deacylase
MRAVVQRVNRARVSVEGKEVGAIGKGMVILVGIRQGDQDGDAGWLAEKCLNLRIFENAQLKFHYSLLDIRGEILAVSQFTVYGDCRRGKRPSFTDAAAPENAEKLYDRFVRALRQSGLRIETGLFGAKMELEIHNDGPVTLIVDSA